MVAAGKRIAECAFDYRGTNHGDVQALALGEHQLFAETFRVAVRVGPSPALRALAPDVLQLFFDPLLAAMLDPGLARIFRAVDTVVAPKLSPANLIPPLILSPS